MATYVALLRGIMPMNPNMRNEKICAVFEGLGLRNARGVIASGNIVFTSGIKNRKKLETMIEKALPQKLKFGATTIIRSMEELEAMVKKDPFKGFAHGKTTYLNVTFVKKSGVPKISGMPAAAGYAVVGAQNGALFSVGDMTQLAKTPDLMRRVEKELGKDVTTRTWKTVERILAVMKKG